MFKLSEFIPYDHKNSSLREALGFKDESMLSRMFDERGNFNRLMFRFWLFDLIEMPTEMKRLPPFHLAPHLVAIVLGYVIPAEKLGAYIDEARASEVIEAAEKFLEEDPEALDCAIKAALGSISLFGFLQEIATPEARLFLSHLLVRSADVEIPESFEDPKFFQLIEKCELDFWFQFPFNILVKKVDKWAHKLLKGLQKLRDVFVDVERELFEQIIRHQAQFFFSVATIEDKYLEMAKRAVEVMHREEEKEEKKDLPSFNLQGLIKPNLN